MVRNKYLCLSPKQRWLLDEVAKGSIEYAAIRKDEVLFPFYMSEHTNAKTELLSTIGRECKVEDAWDRVSNIVKARFQAKLDTKERFGPAFESRLDDYCSSWNFGDFEPNDFTREIARLGEKGLEGELSATLEREFLRVAQKLKRVKKRVETAGASSAADKPNPETAERNPTMEDPIPCVEVVRAVGQSAGRSDKLADKMKRRNYLVVLLAGKHNCQRKDAIAMFPRKKQRILEI